MSSAMRKLAGPAAFATLLMIGSLAPAQATEGVRALSNTCSWEDLSWDELTPAEQRIWSKLGWTARLWDSPDQAAMPASADKDWSELNNNERTAAFQLGFNQRSWEADCP